MHYKFNKVNTCLFCEKQVMDVKNYFLKQFWPWTAKLKQELIAVSLALLLFLWSSIIFFLFTSVSVICRELPLTSPVLVIFLNRCSSRYIVYDVAQINMKYLLKIKFNYQTSLWWEGLRPNPLQWKQRPLLPPNASASFSATEDVWQRSYATPCFTMVIGNL